MLATALLPGTEGVSPSFYISFAKVCVCVVGVVCVCVCMCVCVYIYIYVCVCVCVRYVPLRVVLSHRASCPPESGVAWT